MIPTKLDYIINLYLYDLKNQNYQKLHIEMSLFGPNDLLQIDALSPAAFSKIMKLFGKTLPLAVARH